MQNSMYTLTAENVKYCNIYNIQFQMFPYIKLNIFYFQE
jgi:hypothetical protein